ncbi:Zn peptidase [Scytonema hofmannii PCC 7110]|uniref:Zn peptidase n=1 Tax=Scytonema hofmannii PCC 7110 TaxID=128403 RepID=A0A139XGN0_9CYAN|nr:ImmA/IrrE family metallo-endopeptidase [Scytonema hofmannii]KYC43855.1 Zn peptidase [Scytonema hofmannii PCC 7110]
MNIFKQYQFIPKSEIERQANDLLARMQATPKYSPRWPFDATRVADFLDIGVVWDSIPPDEQGPIAALILPTEREIVINQDVPGLHGGYGESTLAHEIGHWELHINHNVLGSCVERLEQGIEVNMPPFLCRNVSRQLKKIEWQAQYFASCLLMPQSKLEEKSKGRDLTKESHLDAIAHELGVTKRNLKHRLKDLDWIYIPENSKQIYLCDNAPSRETGAFK